MNLVLMGTNDFVVPIFDAIIDAGHKVSAVFTRAPKPVGRKQILTKSPVHVWAESKDLPVYTDIRDYGFSPDMVVVISYGVILRDNVLGSAPCINIHPSDLPRYRAGDVYLRQEFDIGQDDTNDTIEEKVSVIGARLITEFLKAPEKYASVPQTGEITYTRKFTSADEIIDWTRTPEQIHNQIRALGAGRTTINGIDVKILDTRIKDGNLEIIKIQPSGKKPMDWKSFVNGLHGANIQIGQ